MLKYKLNLHDIKTDNIVQLDCESIYFSEDGSFVSGITLSNVLSDGQIVYIGEENSLKYKECTVNTEKVIRHGKMVINNIEYEVDLLSGEIIGFDYYFDNGSDYTVTGLYKMPSYVTKFTIKKDNNFNLNIDNICCSKLYKFINYNDNKYYLYRNSEGFKLSGVTYNNDFVKTVDVLSDNITFKGVDYISLNNEQFEYKLFDEWKNVTNGNRLNLYVDDNFEFNVGQTILAVPKSNSNIDLQVEANVNNQFVRYNGEKYIVSESERYVKYFNEELLFIEIDEKLISVSLKEIVKQNITKINGIVLKYGYIMYNNYPIVMCVYEDGNGNEKAQIIDDKASVYVFGYKEDSIFDVLMYKHIEINGIRHIVRNNKVRLFNSVPIKLTIEDVVSGNLLRCNIFSKDYEMTDVMCALAKNYSDYKFVLINSLYDNVITTISPTSDKGYGFPDYKIFIPTDTINLTVPFVNYNGTNLHQEYSINKNFIEKEIDKSINNIVDMEKDIYYPCVVKNGKVNYVNEIIFDLHFRTRTLDDWNIVNGIYGDTSDTIKCNYNIFDYYNWSFSSADTKTILKPNVNAYKFKDKESDKEYQNFTNSWKYYQPSDLLYFLGFNDKDVYYQKNKIGKSFLRLSFYNSNNPSKCDLLHTSTIFMNEGEYFTKYMDNTSWENGYLSVEEVPSFDKRVIGNSIRTNYETFYKTKQQLNEHDDVLKNSFVTFDESKRLSSRFTIKDMFRSAESSEGFYLYLFKQFSQGLEEQTIYLRVEFNHAGYGKTINFMNPYKTVGGKKTKFTITSLEDIKTLNKGCDLKNLYDNLFIEIKVKYDFDNKKFIYYLPQEMIGETENPNIIHFNLYEVKIANNS